VSAGKKAGQKPSSAFIRSSDEAVEGTMLPGHLAFGVSSAARALASVDVPPTLLVGHTVPGQTFLLGHRTLPPFGQLAKGPRSFYLPIAEVVVERRLNRESSSLASRGVAEKVSGKRLGGQGMRVAEQVEKLSEEQRLHYYEVLAHNLTVSIRGIWSDEQIGDTEKVDRMKWVNEILHSVTAKVMVLRLKSHEWTEADFESLILDYVAKHPGIAKEVGWAVRYSFRTVSGQEM
jgi:hypothetical protein